MNLNLKDKVVVITGAGGIICGGIAEALADTGAKLALLDINQEAVEKEAEKVCSLGCTAKGYRADVLDKNSLEQVREQLHAEIGRAHV